MDRMTSISSHSATAPGPSAPQDPAPPAATPETPAPATPAPPPNVPIANASGPTPDTQPDLAGTKILVLSLYYWPERAGSAPPVQQMAEALARLGAEVTVLTARPAYPEMSVYPEYRNGARDRETQTHSRDTQTNSRDIRSAVSRMPLAPRAKDRDGAPTAKPTRRDLSRLPDLYTAVAPAQLRTQPRPETLLTSLITSLERPTLNRVDRIVTLSQGMVEAIRAIGVKTPLDIIPPTVDDTLIRPLPERPGPFTALYSGNVRRKQGLDQLLDSPSARPQASVYRAS
ncbi:MAG: glycosyltransferase [Thiocapsa sp.]|uniref:glycosyltransferase n=1 Tax=Thiocapsa sp. TaxID=2024551 RepID=UPI001BCD2F07|nr:glycosyltransferase [Thiocapsa sp.]QVL48724.1 MAG: glycosyltransferase [Thiocapsa sp.]